MVISQHKFQLKTRHHQKEKDIEGEQHISVEVKDASDLKCTENQRQNRDEIIPSCARRPRASHSTEVTISQFLAHSVGHLIALK